MKKLIALLILISSLVFCLASCNKAEGMYVVLTDGYPILTTDMTEKEMRKHIQPYLFYGISSDKSAGRKVKNFKIEIPDGIKEGYCELLITHGKYSCLYSTFIFDKDKLNEVGEFTFYNYESIDYLVKYNGSDSVVTLPERGEYYLFERAFTNTLSLERINLGNSVVDIGFEAFSGCQNLEEISFGTGVKSVQYNAFMGCESLSRVEAASLDSWCGIDFFVSYSADSITVDQIDNIINIGTFEKVESDSDIKFDYTFDSSVSTGDLISGGNSFVFVEDGSGVAVDTTVKYEYVSLGDVFSSISLIGQSNPLQLAKSLYVQGQRITNLVIPESVTSIGCYAFYGSDITSVKIHSGVESIGTGAFSSCDGLRDVQLYSIKSDVVATIKEAFPEAAYVDFNGAKYLGNKDNQYMILVSSGTCEGEFTLHEQTLAIGRNAFSGSKGITSVTVHDGVVIIGDNAFSGLNSGAEVFVGSGVVEMGTRNKTSVVTSAVASGSGAKITFANNDGWYYVNSKDETVYFNISELTLDNEAHKYKWYR